MGMKQYLGAQSARGRARELYHLPLNYQRCVRLRGIMSITYALSPQEIPVNWKLNPPPPTGDSIRSYATLCLQTKGAADNRTERTVYQGSPCRSKCLRLGRVVSCVTLAGRDGEIGRRSGLKIRRSERTVGVRFPLPAPFVFPEYIYQQTSE